MENAMVLLYDVCRLCLDEPGELNIFEPVDWTQDILNYTGIKITPYDKLPQTICKSCGDIMTCVKLLKDIATTNDEHLQRLRGNKKNQNESSGSCSKHKSLKHKIVFESDEEGSILKSHTDKHIRKRKSSSSKPESSNAPKKLITVRKDLFESSPVKSSPIKKNKHSSTSSEPDDTTQVTSSEKKSVEYPTSTTSPIKTPKKIKTLNVAGQSFNVFEYEYKCETCSKTYATQKKLYLHQLAHNKKFHCPLDACSKKFATKGDLHKHIRSHTGEKPYKCDLCDQSFTQNVSLKTHKENIHVELHD